jgi:hypothetical protein
VSDQASEAPSCDGIPRRLAESGVGRVTACSCGNIHFDVEYLTLRFVPEAFRELAEMLACAQRKIDAARPQLGHGSDNTAVH